MDPIKLYWTQANYFESTRLILMGGDKADTQDFDGMMLIHSGLPLASFNPAFLQRPLKDPSATIDRACAYFAERSAPAEFVIPKDMDPKTEAELVERGYVKSGTTPAMTLDPLEESGVCVDGLNIRIAQNEADLADFNSTAADGFEMPLRCVDSVITHRLMTHPSISLLVGYAKGGPVSTSCLVTSGPVAGIFWVATPEEYRRRGYGEALTSAAGDLGRRKGCTLATLQASAMGRPIYARMGYGVSALYETYEIPKQRV